MKINWQLRYRGRVGLGKARLKYKWGFGLVFRKPYCHIYCTQVFVFNNEWTADIFLQKILPHIANLPPQQLVESEKSDSIMICIGSDHDLSLEYKCPAQNFWKLYKSLEFIWKCQICPSLALSCNKFAPRNLLKIFPF